MRNNYLLLFITIAGCFLTSSLAFSQSGCSDLDITSVQNESVCGSGQVNLEATPSGNGDVVVWFESDDTANDTIPLYVGEGFVTPKISSTTSYWVSEAIGVASVGAVGPKTPADASSSGSNTSSSSYYMSFDVHQPTTLVSVDVYPATSGSQASIEILDSSANVIETVNYTTNTSSSDGSQAQTVTLNVHLDPGTDYRMKQGTAVSMYRNSGGVSYPFSSPFIDITDNSFSAGYFYYFYNWKYEDIQLDCESSREEVIATVDNVADEEVVAPFPYIHNANTKDYANNYEGSPGADCISSEDYLGGHDVVYHFNADDDYVIEVELDSLRQEYSGVFVYNDCADIGDVCAEEGSVAGDSTDKHGFEFVAENGKDYYFVVSSAESVDSLDYQLSINRMGCNDISTPSAEVADPYFIAGDSLMALEASLKGSKFNEGYRWYEDANLSNEIMRPDTVSIVDQKDYYVTQTVINCQSDALVITPQEFHCSDLNPDILTPVVEMCIPGGYVTLEAQPSPAGTDVYWYDSETADKPISKEEELNVGYVSDSTSYWVTELRIDGVVPQDSSGKVDPTGASSFGSTLNYGLEFDADEDFDLMSVEIYSDDSGEVEISLFDNAGNLMDSATKSVSSGSGPITVPLNFEIEAGVGYRLLQTSSPSLALIRDSTGNDFPYDIGEDGEYGQITNGTYGTSSTNSASYYYFYNWTVSAGNVICESDKKEVKIHITDDFPEAPQVDSPYIFCGDEEFAIKDIEIEEENLQWYDEEGMTLADTTLVENDTTYYVAVQETGGCMSDIVPVKVLIQEFSDQPEADAEQEFNAGDVLSSLEVNGVNLRWYADADKEEELSNDTELIDQATYYVTQTRNGFCESEVFAITVSEVLGMGQQEFKELTYAPNPVKDVLYVNNPKGIEAVEIYDFNGKKIEISMSYSSESEVKLDFSKLSSGTYFMRVEVDGKNKTIQLIKN